MVTKPSGTDIAPEHPVGAGYDPTGHRGSSLGEPAPRRIHLLLWLLGFTIVIFGVAALARMLTR